MDRDLVVYGVFNNQKTSFLLAHAPLAVVGPSLTYLAARDLGAPWAVRALLVLAVALAILGYTRRLLLRLSFQGNTLRLSELMGERCFELDRISNVRFNVMTGRFAALVFRDTRHRIVGVSFLLVYSTSWGPLRQALATLAEELSSRGVVVAT